MEMSSEAELRSHAQEKALVKEQFDKILSSFIEKQVFGPREMVSGEGMKSLKSYHPLKSPEDLNMIGATNPFEKKPRPIFSIAYHLVDYLKSFKAGAKPADIEIPQEESLKELKAAFEKAYDQAHGQDDDLESLNLYVVPRLLNLYCNSLTAAFLYSNQLGDPKKPFDSDLDIAKVYNEKDIETLFQNEKFKEKFGDPKKFIVPKNSDLSPENQKKLKEFPNAFKLNLMFRRAEGIPDLFQFILDNLFVANDDAATKSWKQSLAALYQTQVVNEYLPFGDYIYQSVAPDLKDVEDDNQEQQVNIFKKFGHSQLLIRLAKEDKFRFTVLDTSGFTVAEENTKFYVMKVGNLFAGDGKEIVTEKMSFDFCLRSKVTFKGSEYEKEAGSAIPNTMKSLRRFILEKTFGKDAKGTEVVVMFNKHSMRLAGACRIPDEQEQLPQDLKRYEFFVFQRTGDAPDNNTVIMLLRSEEEGAVTSAKYFKQYTFEEVQTAKEGEDKWTKRFTTLESALFELLATTYPNELDSNKGVEERRKSLLDAIKDGKVYLMNDPQYLKRLLQQCAGSDESAEMQGEQDPSLPPKLPFKLLHLETVVESLKSIYNGPQVILFGCKQKAEKCRLTTRDEIYKQELNLQDFIEFAYKNVLEKFVKGLEADSKKDSKPAAAESKPGSKTGKAAPKPAEPTPKKFKTGIGRVLILTGSRVAKDRTVEESKNDGNLWKYELPKKTLEVKLSGDSSREESFENLTPPSYLVNTDTFRAVVYINSLTQKTA